jgi:hypothetical protein
MTGLPISSDLRSAFACCPGPAHSDRLYGMIPNRRITSLLAEVDRRRGFIDTFTHLHSDAPTEDRRVVLTAVLADATNLGLTGMA